MKFSSLREEPTYSNYLSYSQIPWQFGDFEVRYTSDFDAMSGAVQKAIHSVDHSLLMTHVTTLDEQINRTMIDPSLVAELSAFFGLLAVFLSCNGIYGVMSYVVSRWTNEIGIWMALGAARANVSWLVMREIVILIVIGISLTMAGTRLVGNMLYGIKGTDPMSLGLAVLMLLVVAMFAGYFRARRGARVDPLVALRCD